MWKVKKSYIHGSGIVATTGIKKNTKIIQYIGEIVKKSDKSIRK